MKILICDDSIFMRTMLKQHLNSIGNVEIVGEAGNGVEAVKQYIALKPDVVTMDITMPEKDGIQALKEIRQKDVNAKVIMCSAMGQQAMVIEAIQLGAKDFIVKPFNSERVKSALEKVMG